MIQLCHVDESKDAFQFYFVTDPAASSIETFNAISSIEPVFDVKPEYMLNGELRQEYRDALSVVKREHVFFLNHSSILNAHFIAVVLKLDVTNKE